MAVSSTSPSLAAPTVLAVSCPPALLSRCLRLLFTLGVTLRECGFMTAPTVAAARRPLAILLPEDIYAFDPNAFDALARDVQASLVRVDDDIPVGQLELLLTAAIEDAAARRHELLPAFPAGDAAEDGRRTVPNAALMAYRVGQPPSSPPGSRSP